MEKGLLIDNNHKRNDPIIASKTVGSFVKIDSISIDLPDANDKSSSHAGNCEHFTIRGYVAEVRKKNWKLCCPFPLDGELDKFDQEPTSLLPPLDPPKFRRWSCQNCVLESGSESIARDHGTDIRIGSDSNNKYAQVPHHSDAPLLLLDSEQGSISKTVDGKRVEAHVSVDGIVNEQHRSSSPFDKKEGRHEVAPTAITVNKNVLDDYASHEMPRLNSVEAEVDPKRTQERHKAEAVNLEGNGSVEVWKSGCEIRDDTNIKLHFSNNKLFWNKNLTQNSEAEHRPSAEENHKESMNASGTCKIVGTVDRAGDATKGQTNINHPLHDCDYASSENLDKSSSLNRKNGRKVRMRLLSELGDAKPDCFRTEDSPSNRISNTSGAGTVSQGQVSVQESARVDLGENNKRKLPEEEEQRSQGTSLPKSLNRKVRTSKRDEETTRRVEDSELEEDAVARISLQADMRSNWNRSEIERILAVGKKKIMKSNDIGVCSSLVPPKDVVPIEALDKVGSSSKGNATTIAFSIPAYDASTVREKDQIALPAPKAGRKSGSCKRKDKMPEVDNGLASLFPWPTKGPNTRKDAEFMQTGHPFHRAEDSPAEKGLDLSLNSYLSAQRDDRKSIPQSEDGFPSWSTRKDGTGKLDEFIRKNAEANANLNRLPKPVSNAFSGKIGHDDRSSNFFTYSMPIPNEKQNYRSQVEGSLLQQMDISHARNKDKIIEVPKNSAVTVSRKDSNHRAEKTSHKGAADDIPMEIVEFMAKNHYERNQKALEAGINSRNVQVHSYGFGNLRILEETGEKRKPQARKAKDGATARKNVGPSKQKLVDFSTYIPEKDTFRLDQMHCPTGFNAFSQPKKKMSTREQFPAAGYSSCSCAQNCKWNGDMMSHGLSNSSLRPSVPQSKEEAARLWSPAMPAQTPLTHYNPQKCAAQPSNVDMLSHPPGSLHKGNFHGDYGLKLFNLNATNLEKHSEGVGSEPFSRTNAEYSFTGKRNGTEPPKSSAGSFDLYSNETIPAMHLLSLMDAGMQSSPPFSIAGNPKFSKRPIDFYSKEYSVVDAGGYKVTDTMKHQSSSCCGKNHIFERSLDLFPMNPGGTSTSSYPKGFKRAAVENRGSRSQNSAFKGGVLGKNHGTIPVMHKGLSTLADSTMFPQDHHNTEYPMLQKLDTHKANGAMRPPRSSPNSLICTINKNPAEFSLPEDGNEYMISGKDLKVGKQRHGLVQVDQNKQLKKRKQTTGKGRAQQ
ncbi:protein EMBRYONIC FLOWER 1-like isoform X1 [Pyrus communis]|uniref:protein EMBRYONIC FLOWER 1-like isoform X1 n=1 Tax=Pyrus communis TaxID=23211 RepID=UPI0035C01C4A